MSAAVVAARQGASVWLIEAGPDVGGTVASVLIHTIGGLFDANGEPVNGGLARELIQRLTRADLSVAARRMGQTFVLSVRPDLYRRVTRAWIAEEPRVVLRLRSRVVRVICDEDRIVIVEFHGPEGTIRVRPRSVVDATGTAEVMRLADPALVTDDAARAAGGLIFTLRNVVPGTLAFPRGIGVVRTLRLAAEHGALAPECGKVWIDTGASDDEVYVKLFVPLTDGWRERHAEITRQAHAAQAAVTSFLRGLPSFEAAVPARTGVLGVRDGGRVEGEYRLTGDDVRQGRRFADAACRGCWPIEYWHPTDRVTVEYLPGCVTYDIPLRALKVRGLQNVWAAGKCLSADRTAQASARVAGTCWAMGEAAGRAAAGLRKDSCEGEFCEPLRTPA